MKHTLIFTLIAICSISTLCAQTDNQSIVDKNFRVSLDAGFGYRTGPLANDLNTEGKAHIKRLLTGFNLEGHFSYFLKSNLGLGFTYSHFSAKSETVFFDGFMEVEIPLTEDTSISYIAPELSYRFISTNEKHSLISAFNIGRLKYKDDVLVENAVVLTISGENLGVGFGLIYDYHITPSIAIGAGINHVSGLLNEVTYTEPNGSETGITLEDNERENISRLNINGGIRFYF